MTGREDALSTVYAGQDVWLVKYPSIRPTRARIVTATETVAIAMPYGESSLDANRKQYLKFPCPDAISACVPFPDEKTATAAWNGTVYRAIAELTAQFKENVAMLEQRLIPEPGEESETKEDGNDA